MDCKINKSYYKWIWIAATVIFCLLFTFALIPGVGAQGSQEGGLGRRSYPGMMEEVFNFILRNYVDEVDPQVLFEGAMNGMFGALDDPYSAFLSESDLGDLRHTTEGAFGGVGLNITKATSPRPDGKPMWVEVASPIEDTPGWRAGINPGDFIVEINDQPTENMSMDEVLGILRGTPGEQVKLLIRRGERLEFPVTITRAVIEVPTVKHAMIGDIGYLKLISFTPMTTARAREAINEFKENNYKSLVLDLRYNYGGRLDSAIEIAGLFLDGGLVVSTRSRIRSENREFNTRRGTTVPANIPVIVLINRASASASEIVAGALKDRGRAYLVGENTFGKGSVQQVFPVTDGTGFRITTARYFTPSDANIDKIGIPPDREVKFPEYTEEDAEHLNALINSNKIPQFAAQSPQATSAQIEAFAVSLRREYQLDLVLLRRLIRNELRRTEIAPVYDLEYDIQLQEAINILKSGNYQQLMRDSKPLKALLEDTVDDFAQAS
ncbi:MAG: S41 family peptidase [Treponema sp.]|jgi:carboxyl-terminal processing protease|nr:S41 family peptidase [Treponema sp.]